MKHDSFSVKSLSKTATIALALSIGHITQTLPARAMYLGPPTRAASSRSTSEVIILKQLDAVIAVCEERLGAMERSPREEYSYTSTIQPALRRIYNSLDAALDATDTPGSETPLAMKVALEAVFNAVARENYHAEKNKYDTYDFEGAKEIFGGFLERVKNMRTVLTSSDPAVRERLTAVTEIDAIQAQMKTLEESLKAKQAELTRLEKKSSELSSIKSEHKAVTSELDAMREELEALTSQKVAAEKTLAETEAKIAAMTNLFAVLAQRFETGHYEVSESVKNLELVQFPGHAQREETFRKSIAAHLRGFLTAKLSEAVAVQRHEWEKTPLKIDLAAILSGFEVIPRPWYDQLKFWKKTSYLVTFDVVGTAQIPWARRSASATLSLILTPGLPAQLHPDSLVARDEFFTRISDYSRELALESQIRSLPEVIQGLLDKGAPLEEIEKMTLRIDTSAPQTACEAAASPEEVTLEAVVAGQKIRKRLVGAG